MDCARVLPPGWNPAYRNSALACPELDPLAGGRHSVIADTRPRYPQLTLRRMCELDCEQRWRHTKSSVVATATVPSCRTEGTVEEERTKYL